MRSRRRRYTKTAPCGCVCVLDEKTDMLTFTLCAQHEQAAQVAGMGAFADIWRGLPRHEDPVAHHPV